MVVNVIAKNGFKLLLKTSGKANSEVLYDLVRIQRPDKTIEEIVSFKNLSGKLFQRVRRVQGKTTKRVTTYDWISEGKWNAYDTPVLRQADPNAYVNSGLIRDSKIVDEKGNILKKLYDVFDINSTQRTVTRTHSSWQKVNEDSSLLSSKIQEIQKGKLLKSAEQKCTLDLNNGIQVNSENFYNLSKNEEALIQNDEYFFARFGDNKDFLKLIKHKIATHQHVETNIPLTFNAESKSKRPCYTRISKDNPQGIVNFPFIPKSKFSAVEKFEHELRHAYQDRMVQKLEQGMLSNPAEIEYATKMKQSMKKPLSSTNKEEIDIYNAQVHEDDAITNSELFGDIYRKCTIKFKSIFKNATLRTLGV